MIYRVSNGFERSRNVFLSTETCAPDPITTERIITFTTIRLINEISDQNVEVMSIYKYIINLGT